MTYNRSGEAILTLNTHLTGRVARLAQFGEHHG
jgi:hypothetical protein